MKSKKKVILWVTICCILGFGSVCAYSNDDVKIFFKEDIKNFERYMIESIVCCADKITGEDDKVYNMIALRVYSYKNLPVSNVTHVNKTIELLNEYKYGKAFYSNNSPQPVTLSIERANKSITIPPYRSLGIIWKMRGIGKKTYIVKVSSDKNINLNGVLSIAKSDFIIE